MEHLSNNITEDDLRRRILKRCNIDDYARYINQLDMGKRLLFSMYFIHGYTTGQIASLCKVHPSNIQRRIETVIRQIERNKE